MTFFKSCCSSGVEHFLGKEEVVSSILINSSILRMISRANPDKDRDGREFIPIAIGTLTALLKVEILKSNTFNYYNF